MCPSFMATGEERYSTRGRAHLLWELMQNEVLPDQWENEQVRESLDLCLSCKACKSECPTSVDMATYKAEFLSHHYEHVPRSLFHYAFGRIDRWAHLASIAPGLVNAINNAPGIGSLRTRQIHSNAASDTTCPEAVIRRLEARRAPHPPAKSDSPHVAAESRLRPAVAPDEAIVRAPCYCC